MLLNGIRLTDYRIIYAASNAQFEQPIAEGLAARIADLTNDTLAWHADTEPATEYEILIGHTNRTATASALGGAYLATDGKRILLGGGMPTSWGWPSALFWS